MRKSVLLVEDEDSIAFALQFLLERDGYAFRRVATAKDAHAAIRQDPPALVLLDIMLPGGSGYEICQEIRRDPGLADVKILVLTASGGPMERRKSMALGADAFLSKPFANQDIRGMVSALVGERAA
ncbi:MAG: response regulator [Pseudomonadota bacterium]